MWASNYGLSFEIYKEKAELEYLVSEYDNSKQTCEMLLGHVKTVLEKVQVYELLILQTAVQSKFVEAIELGTFIHSNLAKFRELTVVGRQSLQLLGVVIPTSPDEQVKMLQQLRSSINKKLETT